jgi:hypothetical protein
MQAAKQFAMLSWSLAVSPLGVCKCCTACVTLHPLIFLTMVQIWFDDVRLVNLEMKFRHEFFLLDLMVLRATALA